ncbi:MAG TPA: tetratricopeptide repeat protein [Pirellulales bacterium]|nr:tetratricopeptide repeat protein [Pirellulales bacterium]
MKTIRSHNNFSDRLWTLFKDEQWEKARKLLEKELAEDPDNHWLITQLGVTYYEQRRYHEALDLFLASRELINDCPLTLWHLAGTFDALGRPSEAIKIYTSLLETKVTPSADPCWESEPWSDNLKTDCVYRLGLCFQEQGKKKRAEHCYRQYLNLISMGTEGMYSSDEVMQKLRSVISGQSNGSARSKRLHKAVESVLCSVTSGATVQGTAK